jgi:hypothetical protein
MTLHNHLEMTAEMTDDDGETVQRCPVVDRLRAAEISRDYASECPSLHPEAVARESTGQTTCTATL